MTAMNNLRLAVEPLMGRRRTDARSRQRGSAMIEFVVVGPIISLLGLSILQYGMLFFAKNQINHASFMAARAGSMGNAKLSAVRSAYAKALIPLYGGGKNETELAAAYAKATADTSAHTQIQLLNPTKESFDDWNSPVLEKKYGARAIPNGGQTFKSAGEIRSASGQNIQDANVIKLRITHGYEPKVPLVARMYQSYLKATDPKTDAFYTQLINEGRIPVVSHVTLQMQSDPVEGDNVSTPDPGNGGTPPDPSPAPSTPADPPPQCVGCTGQNSPGTGGNSGGPLTCPAAPTTVYTLPGDVFFEFGQSALTATGKAKLDELIAEANKDPSKFNSVTLTGYTDQLAQPGYDNNKLSLDRAVAVRNYLQAHGFPDKPITAQGLGSQNPVVPLSQCPAGPTQISCLAPNRRVEVRLN